VCTDFRRDHSDATNLALHVVALILQLGGNFSLLAAADEELPALPFEAPFALHRRWLSVLTALLWIGCLQTGAAPRTCTMLASVSIVAALAAGPHISAHWLEVCVMVAFITVDLASSLLCINIRTQRRKPLTQILAGAAKSAALFGVLIGGRFYIEHSSWGGGVMVRRACAADAWGLSGGLLWVLFLISCLNQPVVPTVVVGCFGCR
jgi:hypothetical protein